MVAAGLLIVLLRRPLSRGSLIHAASYAALAAGPLAVVAFYTRAGNSVAGRPIHWHPPGREFYFRLVAGITDFTFPEPLPMRVRLTLAACVILAPFAARRVIRRQDLRETYLLLAMALYLAFLVAVGFLGDAGLDVRRAVQPLFPFALLAAALWGGRCLRSTVPRISVVAAVCAALTLPNIPAVSLWVSESRRNAFGVGARAFRESDLLPLIRALPPDTVVYSNLPEPIYWFTGKPARLLPLLRNPFSQTPESQAAIRSAMAEVARDARYGHAAAVYFVRDDMRLPTMPPGDDQAARCGLKLVWKSGDGAIYRSQGD